jgi:hypothetical protein
MSTGTTIAGIIAHGRFDISAVLGWFGQATGRAVAPIATSPQPAPRRPAFDRIHGRQRLVEPASVTLSPSRIQVIRNLPTTKVWKRHNSRRSSRSGTSA